MIQRVRIRNFLSHEETDVKFQSGLNVITGETDSGKSAFFNALLWGLTNRPLGINRFKNWFAEPKDQVEVSIEFDDGKIEHKRSETKNVYICNEVDVLTAIRSDVPSEVEAITKMGDINFQDQHSLYFLLQQSAGQVSSSFNDVTGLSIIDEVRRETKSTIETLKDKLLWLDREINEDEAQLENFSDLDEVQEKLINAENLLQQINEVSIMKHNISESILSIESIDNEIQSIDELLQALPIIEECERINTEITAKVNLQTELNLRINAIEDLNSLVNECDTKLAILPVLNNLIQLRDQIETLDAERVGLSNLLQNIDLLQQSVHEYSTTETATRSEIINMITENNMCPLCQTQLDPDDLPHILEHL